MNKDISELLKDIENGASGIYDDPYLKNMPAPCLDSSHEPPSHICIPVGKVYKHVCPSCKAVNYLRPTPIYCMSTTMP